MKVLLFIIGIKLVTGGYLPPPDGYYDNRTPTCVCDESKMSSFAEKISQLEINLEKQRTRSEDLEKRITQHERSKCLYICVRSHSNDSIAYFEKFENGLSFLNKC